MTLAAAPTRAPQPRRRGWAYIDLAAFGSNTGRLYLAALWRIVLLPLAAAALLGIAAATVPAPGLSLLVNEVLLPYAPIVIAGAMTVWSTVRIHRRSAITLVAADLRLDWRRLAIGLWVQLAILAGELALLHWLTGWPWRLALTVSVPMLLAGLLLIPLQAASEEIIFRGYLTQALGRVVRSRLAIAAIVAVAFGLAHLNARGGLTAPYFAGLSLLFSLVSLRDEGLELVVGGHAAINLFGFAVAKMALIAPAGIGLEVDAAALSWSSLLVLLVNGALFYGGTRLLVRLVCRRRLGTPIAEALR